jgi:hypothetical protein
MNKNGIIVKYIDSNNFSNSINEKEFTYASLRPGMPDPIRFFSKNFWTTSGGMLVKAEGETLFDVKHIRDDIYALKCNKIIFFKETFENGIFRKIYDSAAWETYAERIIPNENQVFEDTYLDFLNPINFKQLNSNIEANLAFINHEFKYNFYSPKYEELISKALFNIATLPSIWNILNDQKVDIRTEEENRVLSLGGFIDSNYVDRLFLPNINKNAIKEYFDKYAESYEKEELAPVVRSIQEDQSSYIVPKDKVTLSSRLIEEKIPFPLFMSVNFTNIVGQKYSFVDNTRQTIPDLMIYKSLVDNASLKTKNFVNSIGFSEFKIKYFSLLDWINYETFNFRKIEQNLLEVVNTELTSEKSVNYSNLIEYINKEVKIKKRNYSDFNNKSCYYEILFYKIEKRMFNYGSDVIQTFYIEPDESSVIKFIDTQIKYGTEYFYTVKAVTLVVGNKYYYMPYDYSESVLEKNRDLMNGEYKFHVKNEAQYRIYEFEYNRFSGAVHEFPQTKPVLSFKKDKNMLVFNILDSAVEELETYNIVESKEFKNIDQIARSQDNEDNKIISKLDEETPLTIQIYKTLIKPISYMSFEGKLYKTLTMEPGVLSFEDNIYTNQKYYYLFRRLNKHGIPSNTSDVYEIEMIEEGDITYLMSSKIDLNGQKKRLGSKPMKKYLLLKPSITQDRPYYDTDVKSIQDVSFGATQDPVWGKKFLLKIKSKKTNRELHFNISSIINKKNT